jgi:hypothetical protein
MLILLAYYIEHTAQKLGQHLVELAVICTFHQWVDEIDPIKPLKNAYHRNKAPGTSHLVHDNWFSFPVSLKMQPIKNLKKIGRQRTLTW